MERTMSNSHRLGKALCAITVALFIAYIFATMLLSYKGKVKTAVGRTNLFSIGQLTEKFEPSLQKSVYGRFSYITLAGLEARIVDLNSLNDCQKLSNGQLTRFSRYEDISRNATSIAELSSFLRSRGIPFLYVLVPSKNAIYDVAFATGYGDDSKLSITDMLNELDKSKVNVLDMNSWFKDNGWRSSSIFFRTDHHWRPYSALTTARLVMDFLEKQGVAVANEKLLSRDGYHIEQLKECYLGSHGRRTGKYYSGLDDIDLFFIKENSAFQYYGISVSGKWDFSNSLINAKISDEKNLFNIDLYSMYLNGRKPFHEIKNKNAKNTKRILVFGDSFCRPFAYFLSTQFTSTSVMDLRDYKDGSLVQYVMNDPPNIVVMLENSGAIGGEPLLHEFGVRPYEKAFEATQSGETALLLGDIEVRAKDMNPSAFALLPFSFEAGKTYTLTVDSVENVSYDKDSYPLVQMTLENLKTNKAVSNRYFDANKNGRQKWIFSIPDDAATYAVYVYAGLNGATKACSAKLGKVRIREGVHEDW